jgi:glucan 1,3-beta-glucosidase
MGYANAQRAMNYIRTIIEFISQEEHRNVVVGFGLVDEPLLDPIWMNNLLTLYLEAHDMIRDITGYGEGNGPVRFASYFR